MTSRVVRLIAKHQAGLQRVLTSAARCYASHIDPNAGMPPILFQLDSHNTWKEPYMPLPLGVLPLTQASVPRPGHVPPPEPSLELQEPVPVVRVTSEKSINAPEDAVDNRLPGTGPLESL